GLAGSGIDARGVDLAASTRASDPDYASRLASAVPQQVRLVAGVVDGRKIWADDLRTSLEVLQGLGGEALRVSPATSLLHVPYTVEQEASLPVDVASWLSFAEEKVTEVEALATAVTAGPDARVEAFNRADRARRTRAESARVHSPAVRERTAATA